MNFLFIVTLLIYLKHYLILFLKPVPRWCMDYELYSLCKRKPGFEIPVAFGDSVVDFPGTCTVQ